jgi:pilus assembly protein CpaC
LYNYALVGDENPEVLKVYMGEPKLIPVNNAFRVVVGNPNIADVSNVGKSEITLIPKALGTTTLVIWDGFGEQNFKVKVITEDMDVIKERVDAILSSIEMPNVYTKAAEEENKIMLLGSVKTAADREKIATALGTLKGKTVDLITVKEDETSIEIDVQVLEMSKDSSTALGFSWPGNITVTEVGSPGIPGYSSASVSATSGGANTGTTESYTRSFSGTQLDKLFQISRYGRQAFVWSLDALTKEGKVKILSRPRLTCQSGKEAEMFVGGEKPTFSTFTTQVNSGVQIEYKEYGIKLKIKPTVTEDERIKLALYVQVSDVGEPESIGTTTSVTAKAYPITKRNFTTEVYLNDEQTLLIGGLIKTKEEESIRKTPFFGDLPFFGAMFRQKVTSTGGGPGTKGDTELFVTLTPSIMKAIKAAIKKEAAQAVAIKVKAEAAADEIRVPGNIRNYAAVVQRRILENLIYPAAAKQSGFEGTTRLKLRLSYLGQLLDVAVASSSGYKVLDDNSVAVAKSVSSYPPFPPTIQQADLWVEVPVSYRLE